MRLRWLGGEVSFFCEGEGEGEEMVRLTDVFVLDVAARFAFKFCLGVGFLCEMLDEHFLHGMAKG